jgi:hypothetical protein
MLIFGISIYYYIEQIVILASGFIAFVLVILQSRAQKAWSDKVKKIQKVFPRALGVASIIAIIWGIDPRGLYGIYPWYVLGFVKDPLTVIFTYCGAVWLAQVTQILFASSGKEKPKHLGLFLAKIPVGVCALIMVGGDLLRIYWNRVWPIGFMLAWLSVTLIVYTVFNVACLRLVVNTTKAVAKAVEHQAAERRRAARKLKAGAATTAILSLFEAYLAYYTLIDTDAREDTNQVPDRESYVVYTTGVGWLLCSATLFYLQWLPICRKPPPKPVVVSSDNSGPRRSVMQNKRDSVMTRPTRVSTTYQGRSSVDSTLQSVELSPRSKLPEDVPELGSSPSSGSGSLLSPPRASMPNAVVPASADEAPAVITISLNPDANKI